MRKIVICMDGTGDKIGDSETNVLKFYRSFEQDDTQKTHYILGVGTYDGQSAMMRPFKSLKNLLGLAFGWGLEDDVLEAYRWLCRTYQSAEENEKQWVHQHPHDEKPAVFEDDQIYIIGFSRGSYASRVLAGFIHNFGLVRENDLHLIAPAFRAYRAINRRDKDEPANIKYKALRQFEDIMRPLHVPIRALGLFDTVASMISIGRPWSNLKQYQSLADLSIHKNTVDNPSVRSVLHAVSLDERRTFFRSLHWGDEQVYHGNRFRHESTKRTQIVHQRCFAGFHGDIGGSAQEDETGIAKIAALWMLQGFEDADREADEIENEIREADGKPRLPNVMPDGTPRHYGLRMIRGNKEVYFEGKEFGNIGMYNPGGYRYAGPNPRAKLHNSVFSRGWRPTASWAWLILEVLIKSIGRREPGRPAWFRRGLLYYLPLLEPRKIPDDFEVDDSVFIRRDDPACDYDPVNMQRPTPDHLR